MKKYYQELLNAAIITGVVEMLFVIVNVIVPLFTRQTLDVAPSAILASLIMTGIICYVLFAAMNIIRRIITDNMEKKKKAREGK